LNQAYIHELKKLLEAHARPELSAAMSRYMRDQFAFLGIKAPELQILMPQFIRDHGLPAEQDLAEVIEALWALPEREYQYAALAVLGKLRKKPAPERIDLLEKLITTKSWWDTIDSIAGNDAGIYFRIYPEYIPSWTEKWMDSGNFWLQRSALLFQLKYKSQTDAPLLFEYIGRLSREKEFFIRKAIGWVLREYSKTDAAAVRDYVEHQQLSPLSVKEALKWLQTRGSGQQ
jgi:3-methyladenine DNA glycosylase AlkD